ncbi:MAG: FeoB-associated Cys-rich membrane protein [Oscillospiraceae bacterium]|nr:FeoB-associated Cys-rich membrane protein [Oscillospiraceae bacterium]
MKPVDILIIAVIVVILGSAILFLRRAKKKGIKCVGCPDSSTCSGNCGNCSGSCGNCTGK